MMKREAILACLVTSYVLLAGAALGANAQSSVTARGLVAGYNAARIAGTYDYRGRGVSSGWLLGGYLELKGPGRLSWRPELLLNQKGGGTHSETRQLYLQLPLLARLEVGGTKTRSYLVAGPSAALRLKCRDYGNPCYDFYGDAGVPVSDFLLVTTLMAGGGVDVGRFSFGIRYDHGFDSAFWLPVDRRSRTRTIAALVGYRLSDP